MINEDISKSILTIGNRSDKPDGGISQVLYCYRQHVFPVFKSVVNFKQGNLAYKVLLLAISYVQVFLELLFDRKIKIVHIHTASDHSFVRSKLFVNLARFMRKKVIMHIHSGRFNDYYERNWARVDKVIGKCDVVVALTPAIKAFYEKMGCHHVTVINNIIEYPRLQDLRYEDDALHFLFLGVITEKKGIYDLMNVVIDHKEELEGKIFLHIGGNKEVGKLQELINTNKIEKLVKYEGWVSGDKKVDLLNRCDVFILPSFTEGLPISILEAQSYGLFTVATNVGGIPEIVDESNGRLFEPQDKPALYAIMKDLSDDRSFKSRSEMIRERSKQYLPEYVASQLEDMYSGLLQEL